MDRAHLLCLRERTWLNDEVVNIFMGLLQVPRSSVQMLFRALQSAGGVQLCVSDAAMPAVCGRQSRLSASLLMQLGLSRLVPCRTGTAGSGSRAWSRAAGSSTASLPTSCSCAPPSLGPPWSTPAYCSCHVDWLARLCTGLHAAGGGSYSMAACARPSSLLYSSSLVSHRCLDCSTW